ncbi:MAG: hypothetical protein OHK0022_38260 [Roseiflexaceae bacterium]
MRPTYQNPVYPGNFPDPFVLKHCGEYWAYCTGTWPDGRWFGIMRSPDLVTWQPVDGALEPLPGVWPCQWAPEVVYDNGRFWMYYSLGDEATMHIRVAVAERPEGPFVDSGRQLTRETFAIDAHVFVDDDGARYLFYATDFLEHSHIGTGTVYDRLLDPWTPAGAPQPVTRARYDWQVYDPQRAEKGGVRWHTVEGPFVLKRKGRYVQMFSAGNWQNPTYGVSYAVSAQVDAPGEWEQAADGKNVLPVLQTIPGLVIGPGHNSVVRGPDNIQQFAVYHRWSPEVEGRAMAIDPLDWAGDRLLVFGPSTTPQPTPRLPAVHDLFEQDADGLDPRWSCAGGNWRTKGGAALQTQPEGLAEAALALPGAAWVCEVSLRALPAGGAEGSYGLALSDGDGPLLRVLLAPGSQRLRIVQPGLPEQGWDLPPEFAAEAFHLLRLTLNGQRVGVALDGGPPHGPWPLDRMPTTLALQTEGAAAAFAGFGLAEGWEDLFEQDGQPLSEQGWQGEGWQVRDRLLACGGGQPGGLLRKSTLAGSYELVVSLRAPTGRCGICPALSPEGTGPLLSLAQTSGGWTLVAHTPGGEQALPLPDTFDPQQFQQFRFQVGGGRIAVAWGMQPLGEIAAPGEIAQVGLAAEDAGAVFDMVRVSGMC